MRYWFVVPLLVLASVPPLFIASFAIVDRFNIPVPVDGFLFFCAAGFMAGVGMPISLFLVLFAGVSAASIYVGRRIESRRQGK
jgi:membrane protein implicated in regulation of membrane protease activity